jgi:hypothetical protein
MLVSLVHTRVWARRLATSSTVLLPLAACSGGDLLLPDRTPAQLEVVSGDGQSAVAGSQVPNPLVVKVLDRDGRPVEGAIILFEFVDPPNGAAIAPPAAETNSGGQVAVEVTLGTPAGDQPVRAQVDEPASDLHVLFQLTAIRSNTGGGGGGNGGGGGGGGGDNGDDEGGGGHHGKGKGKNGNNDNSGHGNGDD